MKWFKPRLILSLILLLIIITMVSVGRSDANSDHQEQANALLETSNWLDQRLYARNSIMAGQDTNGGYWQLVNTVEEPGDSSFNASYHGELCSTHTVNWSNGKVTDSVSWPKTTSPDRYSYCENTRSMTYSGSASWTPPPKVLIPDDEINLNGSVTIHERDTVWPAGVTWSVGYNTTHVCGVNPREGTEYCENQAFTVQTGTPGSQFVIGVTVTVTWGNISPGGASMNSMGLYQYVYEWVEGDTAVVAPPALQEPRSNQVDPPSPPQFDPPSIHVDSPPFSIDSWWLPFGIISILAGLGLLGALGIGGLAVLIAIIRGWGKPRDFPNRANPLISAENEATIGAPNSTVDWGKIEPGLEKEWIKSQIASEIEFLRKRGYFIGNISKFRQAWNLTLGQVTNPIMGWKHNMHCEEMTYWGNEHLGSILPEGSYVSQISIERNDAFNHIANKVILPDGTEFVVDYWQSLADGKPAIYTVDEWMQKWEKALGKPRWGDWKIHEALDGAQADLIDHVLKNGEESIDEWRFRGKAEDPEKYEIIREWWRSLDEATKKERKSYFINRFPEHEKEMLIRQMRHGRIKRTQ